ncbi:hypothetical protein V5799_015764 [Amblyomma americanum]|uniref:Evasin n=1 Tax=Amblyomma americanum TaxID=6943 RepID=A0AAQ4F6W6_AMBAM
MHDAVPGIEFKEEFVACLYICHIYSKLSFLSVQIQVGCYNGCTIPGTPTTSSTAECIAITTGEARRMQHNLRYSCPVGHCVGSTCQTNGLHVECFYTGKDNAS